MSQPSLNPTSPFFHEERHASLAAFADRPITICGAGALGGSLTETLARMGFSRLTVIDRDRVEMRNLSTQPYSRGEVGAPKARVLAAALYRAVGARVEPQHVELTPANATALLKGSEVVVDAFDNLQARRAVSEAAAGLNVPCLHIALGGTGDYGCGLWDEDYSLPNSVSGMDGCDYPLTRPLVLLVAAAAAEVLTGYLLDDSKRGFEVTLRDLRVASA